MPQAEEKREGVGQSAMPIASLLKRNEIRLLLVEDDKFLRELLSGKLEREGYTVFGAFNGEEAVNHLRVNTPHLILLDLVLPGSDGFEILANLKQNPETANIPVIVLSNLGSRDDIDKAMNLGARNFMVKAHHTPQEIVETIKKVLGETYLRK